MIVYNGTLIDLKTTITNIANISVSRSTWGLNSLCRKHWCITLHRYTAMFTQIYGEYPNKQKCF